MLGPLCLPEAKTYWGEGLKGTCGPPVQKELKGAGGSLFSPSNVAAVLSVLGTD